MLNVNKKGQNIVISFSVSLSIVFYQVFIKYITKLLELNDQLSILLIGVVTSTGVFFISFNFLTFLYYKFLEDLIFKKEAITGDWFYKLEVFGNESSTKFGICTIEKYEGKLTARGTHYDPKEEVFTSLFFSDYLIVDDDKVIINYSSRGVDGDVFDRKGIYYLTTEGKPPTRINGIWTDVLNGKNRGRIFLQKRDKESDNLLKEVGYPFEGEELKKLLKIDEFRK